MNEQERIKLKWLPFMTFKVILPFMEKSVSIMLVLIKSFGKIRISKKYIKGKDDFLIKMWPFVNFNDLLGHTLKIKNLRLHHVSVYIIF